MNTLYRILTITLLLLSAACANNTPGAPLPSAPTVAPMQDASVNIMGVRASPPPSVLHEEVTYRTLKVIQLTPPQSTKRLMWGTEHFRFQFQSDEYLDHLSQYIADHPQLHAPLEEHKAELEAYFQENETWTFSGEPSCFGKELKTCVPAMIPPGATFIAEMLEAGQVSIYDKSSQSNVPQVEMREYWVCFDQQHELCSEGYRGFYLSDGTPILIFAMWLE